MVDLGILIDGAPATAREGATVLAACWEAGAYVPALCAHPDLATKGPCGLCIVEVGGEVVPAGTTQVAEGIRVVTHSDRLETLRRARLSEILAHHPHDCLTCQHRDGCDRTDCSLGLEVAERCCDRFGSCEVQKVADYVGINADTPRFRQQGLPAWEDDPALRLDLERCIGCRRCVDACNDLQGAHALEVFLALERVLVRPVAGPLGGGFKASGCRFCGACVEVCPAGALIEQGKQARRWRETTRSRLQLRHAPLPPARTLAFDRGTLATVPEGPGVYRLWTRAGQVLLIEGAPKLREALVRELGAREGADGPEGSGAATCDFEEAPMFTQRANELLAAHLKEFGRLPAGNELDDDLF